MQRAAIAFAWREWLRQRSAAGAQRHHLWPGFMSAQPRDIVAVALAPVCSTVLRVVRHSTALELGAMAQSLAGLPVSALIPSASCGSCVWRDKVCASVSWENWKSVTVPKHLAASRLTQSAFQKIQRPFIALCICRVLNLIITPMAEPYSSTKP